ncbi:efflux RND transporter permease subunit [Cohnella pontilimi]|uniref:Efflux RND transporter permease subunit n=1 Tax=Cohnella pontilimi TaxID=2564100 RepID=A0A4U0FAL9_9BACL|nr:efflux RND transporter permease subunit [Cohnella pontilimi]TJY41578.1 efflux RND transporter permease subunit [Cohnella pontilimi]
MLSVIRFSMRNSIAVFLIIALLVAGGLYSVNNMKMEKYPDVDIPYLHMRILYPGASPEQVMNDIGKPLEQELANVKGKVNMYTGANPNVFWSTLQFNMSVDMDDAEQRMRDAVAKLKLPDTAGEPSFQKERLDAEVYQLAVYGGTDEQVQQVVDESIVPAIRNVSGIDEINILGESERNLYIRLRPDALKEYKLSYDQVKQLIAANNLSIPIGDLRTPEQTLPIRAGSAFKSAEDVSNIPLLMPASSSNAILKLGDIAEVAYEAPVTSFTRMNGKPALLLSVIPKPGEDAVSIANQVKDEVAGTPLPTGLKSEVMIDRSVEIEHSVSSMLREVMLGALMAVVVTLLFLRNVRATIIAIISIPLSMFASFMVLQRLGYTLNMMTLAGIAVAIGRVVDDSIVVIENIFRRIRMSQERGANLVEQATREVSSAITSSTLTTVAVFLPLAFVPGIVGKFFVPLAWTIVISLLFSLLVAVSVVPLMSRLSLLRLKHVEPRENRLQITYRAALHWSLGHRLSTLGLAVVLLLGSAALVPSLGFNFLPSEQVKTYDITVKMPVGTALSQTDDAAKQIEAILKSRSEVARVGTYVSGETANLSFTVKDDVSDTNALAKQLREKFKQVAGPREVTLAGVGGINVGNRLQITVNGPNIGKIKEAAGQITEALKGVEGLADVRNSAEGEKPEITIEFDNAKLAAHGLTPATVSLTLHNMVQGSRVSEAQIEGKTTGVILSTLMDSTPSLSALEEQTIPTPMGTAVKLKNLGTVKQVVNPTTIAHYNQAEYLQVNGTITETNSGKVTADAEKAMNALKLPDGVTWRSEGASKEMNDGFVNMGIALALSVFLVYMVMLLAFGEWKLPFVILAAIPFSVIGALAGLYAVGEPVGMPAMIGLLMLNGIVVTNAIVLLERVRSNMRRGLDKHAALMEAGATRVRPILMTAIATIGALLPLALSTEAGLVSRALAVVVIGGLTTSTFLTLLIVPVLFSLVTRGKRKGDIPTDSTLSSPV